MWFSCICVQVNICLVQPQTICDCACMYMLSVSSQCVYSACVCACGGGWLLAGKLSIAPVIALQCYYISDTWECLQTTGGRWVVSWGRGCLISHRHSPFGPQCNLFITTEMGVVFGGVGLVEPMVKLPGPHTTDLLSLSPLQCVLQGFREIWLEWIPRPDVNG